MKRLVLIAAAAGLVLAVAAARRRLRRRRRPLPGRPAGRATVTGETWCDHDADGVRDADERDCAEHGRVFADYNRDGARQQRRGDWSTVERRRHATRCRSTRAG